MCSQCQYLISFDYACFRAKDQQDHKLIHTNTKYSHILNKCDITVDFPEQMDVYYIIQWFGGHSFEATNI